jgi:hypothetical protein
MTTTALKRAADVPPHLFAYNMRRPFQNIIPAAYLKDRFMKKKSKVYRIEYPASVMFDVEADTQEEAIREAHAVIDEFDGCFDNGWNAPFDEGRTYLVPDGDIAIADVMPKAA